MKLVKPDRAAAELGKSEQTLRHWRVQGRGPRFYKSGHHVLYDIEEIRAWLAARCYRSTSEHRAQ